MLKTLRRRLIVSHTLVLFLIVPLMGFALIYILESQVLLSDISRELKEQALLVVRLTEDHPEIWTDPEKAQAFAEYTGSDISALVVLLDRNGYILAASDSTTVIPRGQLFNHPGLSAVLAGQISEHSDYSPRLAGQIADVIIPVFGPDHQVIGVVRLAHRLETFYDQFMEMRFYVIGILGIALILGTLAGGVLAIQMERPLREVTRGINRLASGQELAALTERGPEEIRTLGHAFNVLMNRLRGMQESRRQLLANMVHELSTPLGALSTGVQALQEGADEDPELRRDLLRGMHDEISRLIRLFHELTHMYDQVLGQVNLNRRATALNTWLPNIIAIWREAALKKGLHWETEIAPDLPTLEIDSDRLTQALGNLLNNAIKYTDKGGAITVAAAREPEGVQISVSDTGRGIAPDELEKIFAPFFRGREAGRFPEGMGLGLAISRELVAAHGGKLSVESTLGIGSRFTLWLPN